MQNRKLKNRRKQADNRERMNLFGEKKEDIPDQKLEREKKARKKFDLGSRNSNKKAV